jgi:FtsP/CotA-like multicopper oxidase with cupredoxin domain
MNFKIPFRKLRMTALALVALAVMAGPSFAQTYNLCATTGTVTIDGEPIYIWGFGLVENGTCDATLPGPVLRATAGQTLTINLTNNLAEPVSFFVPGLRPTSAGGSPGKFTGEVGPSATVAYSFTPRAGTFLYHSATDRIRTHVPMGLYGALVVDSGPNTAYPGVGYVQDRVLVFSAIDPNLNAAPLTFDGAKVVNWVPQFFLINGKAFPGTEPIDLTAGANVLLRFVNAGLKSVMPTLEGGLYLGLIAEDGFPYPHPIQQYGLELPAGKTIDAMINVADTGSYALYDRALNLTNRADLGGGMLTYLAVAEGTGVNVPPVANVGGPYSGTVGLAVNFSGSGSYDPDGSIDSYAWNFGDGSPVGTGVSPSHTYAEEGTYNVTLTVTDNLGATDDASTTATITAAPETPTVHIGDLDGTAANIGGNRWRATVTATVHNQDEELVAGAVVTGTWSAGDTNGRTLSCTTGAAGTCQVTSGRLNRPPRTPNHTEVTFTVTNVTAAGADYAEGDNHESSITVLQP